MAVLFMLVLWLSLNGGANGNTDKYPFVGRCVYVFIGVFVFKFLDILGTHNYSPPSIFKSRILLKQI